MGERDEKGSEAPGERAEAEGSAAVTPTEGGAVSERDALAEGGEGGEGGRGVRVFEPGWLERQLRLDRWLRGLAGLGLAVGFYVLLVGGGEGGEGGWGWLVALGLVVGWVWLTGSGVGVMRALPAVSLLIDSRPAEAETRLAGLLRRRALPGWVRLTLMHRLALLRHRQERFAESAAIAQTLLVSGRAGPGRRRVGSGGGAGVGVGARSGCRVSRGSEAGVEDAEAWEMGEADGSEATEEGSGLWGGARRGGGRGNLLLLLVEARLETGELGAAWWGLCELSRTRLTLTEALQRMALRTRYELRSGRAELVLVDAEAKARLAGLMPGPQGGAFCAMLSAAARQVGDEAARRRWGLRAELLCDPEQLARMRERGEA